MEKHCRKDKAWQIIRRLIYSIIEISRSLKENKAALFAASSAFFAFLSLIPTMILICSILPFIHGSRELFLSAIEAVIPYSLESMLVAILEESYEKSVAVISLSAILTLWVAGKGVYALKAGINAIRHVRETRGVLLQRLVASLYTIVFILCIVFSLGIMIFGNYVNELLIRIVPGISFIYQFLLHFRFLFVWAVMTVFLQLVFALLPNEKVSIRLQFPGALFSSIVWSVFSWVFSIYVDKMNGFGMYGSLTTIVVVMMWLYIGFYILLIGVSLNVYIQDIYAAVLEERKLRKQRASKESGNKGENL